MLSPLKKVKFYVSYIFLKKARKFHLKVTNIISRVVKESISSFKTFYEELVKDK
jgi:hypothetical protein